MKRLFSFSLLFLMCMWGNAQDAPLQETQPATRAMHAMPDTSTIKNGWTKGGAFSLYLTQVGNSNWMAAGGDKFTLSLASSLNAFATKRWGRKKWETLLDVNYALLNTSSLGVRKINDRIDFITKFSYQLKKSSKVSFASLAQLRSQLSRGYEYDYFGTSMKRRNSGFFAPAYITVAPLGVEWQPVSWFFVFASPAAARWTAVSNGPYSYAAQGGTFEGHYETPLATLYGVNPVTPNRGEFGAFVTATLKKDIMKNITYYSKVDLYSNYLKNWTNVDLFWTNQIKMRVNKWIQVSYTLDMLYDDDVIQNKTAANAAGRELGLQVLSTLGVGLSCKL